MPTRVSSESTWIRACGPGRPQLSSVASRLHGAALRGKLGRMATPITVSIPHQLGRAEARRRIEAGFAKIIHLLPGSAGNCSERWGVAAMGQTVAGVINVLDAAVMMEIELPSVFGMLASGLRDPQGSAPEGGTAATYEGVAQCRSRLGASEQGAKSLAGKPFGLLSADPDNRSPYLAGRSA